MLSADLLSEESTSLFTTRVPTILNNYFTADLLPGAVRDFQIHEISLCVSSLRRSLSEQLLVGPEYNRK